MKAAIYARVSKEEEYMQDPENQLIQCRKMCDSFGWEVKREYIDRCSGAIGDRPAFKEMLSHVRQGHYDIIVVWALDRFSREGVHKTLGYIEQLNRYKTHLKSYQENWIDTQTPGVSELLLTIMSWMAAEERRKISERTKAALQKLKAQGKKLGRPSKKGTGPNINKIKFQLWKKANEIDSIRELSRDFGISRYMVKRAIMEGVKKGVIKNKAFI